ncbi:hypothetical protein FOB84_21100 [Gordonia bronchialis]|nr:hypothetical protein [Gordonia bronchialis]MCC3322649.1 hypothetical protein [Gordonia bronchialis]QGS26255.1 hypothetical protein FOB84_21100 [Gordonia bronchialis]
MSDNEFEYVDEDGNVVDPSELGDEYEIVDEEVVTEPVDEAAPVPVTGDHGGGTATGSGMPKSVKLTLGAVGLVALAVGGALVVGLSKIGSENTAADVKAGASSKYAQASSAVASKSSAVRSEVDATVGAVDTCRVGAAAASSPTGTLADAVMTGSARPRLELVIDATAPLPTTFVRAKAGAEAADAGQGKKLLARNAKRLDLIQLGKDSWAAYAYTAPDDAPAPAWRKADVTVADGDITVTGDRDWPGGDAPTAGSCEHGTPGAYAVSGQIPAGAAGLVDGTATVHLIQGVAGQPTKAVAVMGDAIALVTLAASDDAEGGDASASSSAVPSK